MDSEHESLLLLQSTYREREALLVDKAKEFVFVKNARVCMVRIRVGRDREGWVACSQ